MSSAPSSATGNIDHTLLADSPPMVVKLEAGNNFEALDDQMRHYAHHLSRVALYGSRIILRQVSPESETIYDLILSLYRASDGNWEKLRNSAGLSDKEMRYFLEYAAMFLGNMGNYRSFGDRKFIPRLPLERLAALVAVDAEAQRLFDSLSTPETTIYLDRARLKTNNLGFPDQGCISNYYPEPAGITEDEIRKVDSLAAKRGLRLENTRLRKLPDGDFEMLIASAIADPVKDHIETENGITDLGPVPGLSGGSLRLVYGDHAEQMHKIAEHARLAAVYAANEAQQTMLEYYALSYETGSLKAFKESQRKWVQDIGPTVETNIGFIEAYRDPAGVRAQWEGFVAVVDEKRTKAFSNLIASAGKMLPKLPWPAEFEASVFTPPEFTSLGVINFATSGLPGGIDIPNYEDIRQELGFKNVALINVLNAQGSTDSISFLAQMDLPLYERYRDAAFEIRFGLHQLLGYGSGKLLQETSPGKFNFDIHNPPVSPVTKKPITSYYKPNETYISVFGLLGASYEECRAECVALTLCADPTVLAIFGQGDGALDTDRASTDLVYAYYLSIARAGLLAIKYWDPSLQKWTQPHMQALFAIMQTLLRAGENLIQLEYTKEDLSDLTICLDRSKISSIGRPAIALFLQKLQIFKATADVQAARALNEDLTRVDLFWGDRVRKAVLALDEPRKVFVQGNTRLQGGKVVWRDYDASLEGMIQSVAERHV